MGLKADVKKHADGTFDLGITCDVSGMPLDQVDETYGMYCSAPDCKCLAESKAVSPGLDAFMKDLMDLFPPKIGDGK